MNMKCERCEANFEADTFRGYCDECLEFFAGERTAQAPCRDRAAVPLRRQ